MVQTEITVQIFKDVKNVVKKVEYDVSEVDLRYGSVSYRKKQFLTDTIAE